MKTPIQISIPTPCHENWDAMMPEEKGRFCASCQKKVIDFTSSSDREIASILKKNKNTCGRLKVNQLDRQLIIPKEKSSVWMVASAAFFSFITLGNHVVLAQTPPDTEQIPYTNHQMMGKVMIPTKYIIVKCNVIDYNDALLPGANVVNLNSNLTTTTDLDGNFSIKAQVNDTIRISSIGLESQNFIVKSDYNSSEIIQLKLDFMLIGDIYIEKKRTFFGRIFHSIGNLFR